MQLTDFPAPHPVQCQGNRLALWVLHRLGWTLEFQGLPALQGVLAVYPHTSNWDFVLLLIAKWALGVPVRFWGKDSLFRIPLFGTWLRWLGGVAIQRTSAQGVVASTVEQMCVAKEQNQYFWLALAPEGTRKRLQGWRSGFYRTAVAARVPLGLVCLNYPQRRIGISSFLQLSGNENADFDRMAAALNDAVGFRPDAASPIRLLDASVPRTETIVK
jgi:1-acyl-sn-glycerol-3-phosphate acyltransferase